MDEEVAPSYSFIIVKKGFTVYYVADKNKAKEVIYELPGFGTDIKGIYYTTSKHLVRQLDFYFSDGDEGSLYIISGIRTGLTTSLVVYIVTMTSIRATT